MLFAVAGRPLGSPPRPTPHDTGPTHPVGAVSYALSIVAVGAADSWNRRRAGRAADRCEHRPPDRRRSGMAEGCTPRASGLRSPPPSRPSRSCCVCWGSPCSFPSTGSGCCATRLIAVVTSAALLGPWLVQRVCAGPHVVGGFSPIEAHASAIDLSAAERRAGRHRSGSTPPCPVVAALPWFPRRTRHNVSVQRWLPWPVSVAVLGNAMAFTTPFGPARIPRLGSASLVIWVAGLLTAVMFAVPEGCRAALANWPGRVPTACHRYLVADARDGSSLGQ